MLIKKLDLFIGPAPVHLHLQEEPIAIQGGNTSPTFAYVAHPHLHIGYFGNSYISMASITFTLVAQLNQTRFAWFSKRSQYGLARHSCALFTLQFELNQVSVNTICETKQ